MALPAVSLTEQQLKDALPEKLKKSVSKELLQSLNQTLSDPILGENLRDNIIGYAHVMQNGKFKLSQYINAVNYVSFKVMGATNLQAYSKTFPDKYQEMLNKNVSTKDINSYVCAYNKGKLVNLIYEQTLIPTYILNADMHQKALNVQADLMLTAKSEKVRSDAANSLLTHLKAPEVTKVEMDIKHSASDELKELKKATMDLVEQQRQSIAVGQSTAKDIAHSKVIEGNCEEVG